ncbi:MAG: adenylate/guanylate cyclase domain-containing protein, partial [Candidatus Competibacteraceae bacterium]|nr:adenylate/guanylate cyclase domain-containing protein [Candidatus Competibacteraceae bacterium]
MKFKLSTLAFMLGAPPTPHQQEPATVLFADISGSTRLFEQYGDVHARQIENRVLDLLAEQTIAHQGVVVKTIGDEIMSRFPEAIPGIQAACDMQKVIKHDPVLADLNIAIRIGLHHGTVLIEKNDVFGDAVNVAARMVTQAKADQIITNRETVTALSPELQQRTRDLGKVWVRGKQDEMEIVEVIWYESTSLTQMSALTQMSSEETQKALRNLLNARLLLNYHGQDHEVAPSAEAFTIGRGPRNRLVVDRELVSRSHAAIEFRQGKFILADHSTNGTYLLLENGSRFFVRREE